MDSHIFPLWDGWPTKPNESHVAWPRHMWCLVWFSNTLSSLAHLQDLSSTSVQLLGLKRDDLLRQSYSGRSSTKQTKNMKKNYQKACLHSDVLCWDPYDRCPASIRKWTACEVLPNGEKEQSVLQDVLSSADLPKGSRWILRVGEDWPSIDAFFEEQLWKMLINRGYRGILEIFQDYVILCYSSSLEQVLVFVLRKKKDQTVIRCYKILQASMSI